MLVFEEWGNPEYSEKNLLEQKTNDKLKPYMTPGLGIESGTHGSLKKLSTARVKCFSRKQHNDYRTRGPNIEHSKNVS